MQHSLRCVLVLIVLSCCAAGDDARPRSTKAIAAIKKHDSAVAAAEREYHRAVEKARQTLLAELKVALNAALRGGDLDEANAIKSASEQLSEGAGASRRRTFTVAANLDWQPMMEVRRGQELRIVAKGKWRAIPGGESVGPGGSMKLLGRWGSTDSFTVGDGVVVKCPKDTVLSFRTDDTMVADNEGEVTVVVEIK